LKPQISHQKILKAMASCLSIAHTTYSELGKSIDSPKTRSSQVQSFSLHPSQQKKLTKPLCLYAYIQAAQQHILTYPKDSWTHLLSTKYTPPSDLMAPRVAVQQLRFKSLLA
jgi:hypothetical protein